MNKRVLGRTALYGVITGLCLLLPACQPSQDTRAVCLREGLADLVEERWVEPRLNGGFAQRPCSKALPAGRAVEVAQCSPPHKRPSLVSWSYESCDTVGRRHVEALRTLILRPDRTDEAVEMLQALADQEPMDARIRNDVAAAYLVHAQRTDQASDLPRSLEAAQRATESSDRTPEALFNLALVQGALRLSSAALSSWDEYLRLDDSSRWAAEAREHRQRLAREATLAAATQWPLNQQRLADATRAGDRQAIAQLIAPFPGATQLYLEGEVLPAWARDLSQGREPAARQNLAAAQAISSELARLTGDRYLADVVEVIVRASRSDPERLRALREGHLAFGRARHAQVAHQWEAAGSLYQQAGESLRRSGSPLGAGAELGLAIAQYQKVEKDSLPQVLTMLEPLEREARERRYKHLLGRVLWIRALCLILLNRPIECLETYSQALDIFERTQDGENVVNIRTRKSGVLRILGEGELAWRESFQALRHLSRLTELQSRHHLLGEAAASVLALDHPRIALLYQDQAVRLIENELANLPERQQERISGLRVNLAIALQERAAIQLASERLEQARIDLAQSSRLAGEPPDRSIQRVLQARIREVEGDALLSSDPQRAIGAFTGALALLPPDEFRTFRASILFKRALASREVRRKSAAEQDLKQGIRQLRAEENSILATRPQGKGEELWMAYFSRFQDAYKLLIRFLVEDGRHAEAFAYAEKVRAFEPLDLLLQLPSLPEPFRQLVATREQWGLAEIQRHLPHGTFLIEYCMLEDRVFIWIVRRDGFNFVTRAAGATVIESWTKAIHRAARYRNAEDLESELSRPFADLVAPILEPIAQVQGGRTKGGRLVFVPDGAIHGLPMAALRDPKTKRYLTEDFTVSIAPSATLYIFSLLRDREKKLSPQEATRALLIGDPAFDSESDLSHGMERLTSAQHEVERIWQIYGPGTVVLTGRNATVDRFFAHAGTSTVVHFAGHAIINPRAPFRSLLLLAPSRDHSGALPAEELLTELRAGKIRLFVLSACSSAGGHPLGPEGLAALVRPVITAGVPAVVGSLWDVPDTTTEELFVEFHRRYTAGADAASALRGAQLELLSTGSGVGSALAWAPFQVIGYASSSLSQTNNEKKENSP